MIFSPCDLVFFLLRFLAFLGLLPGLDGTGGGSIWKLRAWVSRGKFMTILWLEPPPLEPIELFSTSALSNADAEPAECV